MQKKVMHFDELSIERMGEINSICKKIDANDLTYYFKNKNIIGFRSPLYIYENKKNGKISIKKQKKIKNNLNQI